MILYIISSFNLTEISNELGAALAKDESMLIYYTKNGPAIPEAVLDYISAERARIRRLPKPIKDCTAIISYEIGRLHVLNPDMEFVLWGGEPFPEIYKMLIQYDRTIKNITIRALKKEQKKERLEDVKRAKKVPEKAVIGKGSLEKATVKSSVKQLQKPVASQENKLNIPAVSMKKRTEDIISEKEKMDTLGGNVDISTIYKNNEGQINRALNRETQKEIECAFSGFKRLLDGILDDKTTDEDCWNVMLSVMELAGIVDSEAAQSIYKDKLRLYFLSCDQAEYFWEHTRLRLTELMNYLKE